MFDLGTILMKRHNQNQIYKVKSKHFLVLFIVMVMLLIASNACIVEHAAYLNIENGFLTDIIFTLKIATPDGDHSESWILGTVPAGETKDTPKSFIYGGIGLSPKLLLQGNETSGNLVWQKSWKGTEFLKLKNLGWKIKVSPETSD